MNCDISFQPWNTLLRSNFLVIDLTEQLLLFYVYKGYETGNNWGENVAITSGLYGKKMKVVGSLKVSLKHASVTYK